MNANTKIRDFVCPEDCVAGIGEVLSGMYEVPVQAKGAVRVLDIGGNVGAFTWWALWRWPECVVTVFEPLPGIFDYLKRNVGWSERVECVNAAVGDPTRRFLYRGRNRLCTSQYDLGPDSELMPMPIKVVRPEEIGEHQIVKIDCEGAEGYIVERLQWVPLVMMVEWHGEENRRRVERALEGKMELIGGQVLGRGYGVAKYVRGQRAEGRG